MERIEMSCELPAPPARVFEAWLSAEGHSAMTGSPATFDEPAKGDFSAWDGYITGHTIEAAKGSRILQSWRTTDFSEADEDSRLEILLEAHGKGTKLTLKHSRLPAGSSADYEKGWLDFYFEPMKSYFSS
jgi:activator of HSP90 ATPase